MRDKGDIVSEIKPTTPAISQTYIVPINNAPLRDGARPLYQAVVPPGATQGTFFPENTVPFNSVVINTKTIREDGRTPDIIAQALLKANPAIQFIVPTQTKISSKDDPAFYQERLRISESLRVPVDQVFPVPADMPAWPQDEFMAGSNGVISPSSDRMGLFRSDREIYARRGEHWLGAAQRSLGGVDFSFHLSLGMNLSSALGRGGDLQVLQRPGGELTAIFGPETARDVALAHSLDEEKDFDRLKSISIVMKGLNEAGVPLNNILPMGTGDKTYGQVLDALSPQEKRLIDPKIMVRLHEMRHLPFPEMSYQYHVDMVGFSPDGRNFFVDGKTAEDNPDLERQLRFFNYDVHRLPGGELPVKGVINGKPYKRAWGSDDPVVLYNYANAIYGTDPKTGQSIILMPTVTDDPARLTEEDKQALETFSRVLPEVRIIPVGGHSALIGDPMRIGVPPESKLIYGDWGIHCMTNLTPYVLHFAH